MSHLFITLRFQHANIKSYFKVRKIRMFGHCSNEDKNKKELWTVNFEKVQTLVKSDHRLHIQDMTNKKLIAAKFVEAINKWKWFCIKNETRVFVYEPETKLQWSEWHKITSQRLINHVLSNHNWSHVDCGFDVEGLIYRVFVPNRQTVILMVILMYWNV